MKIKLLELEQFAAIYVGLGRNSLRLDFSTLPNIITLIVGDMGSGKTTILSQLHPWANIGTSDERNSDQMIKSEVDGMKHIIFEDTTTNDIIDITHRYIWSKDHHTTKSSFKLNGEELNPNGNQTSFKELVTKFMGIDQSYLRISRVGPNVTNLIDMNWGERKTYIASMIQSADIYANLLVKVRQELRNIDANLNTVTRQLMNVTDDDIKMMENKKDEGSVKIKECQSVISNISDRIQACRTECDIIFRNVSVSSPSEYRDLFDTIVNKYDSMTEDLELLNDELLTYGNLKLNDILSDIGKNTNALENSKKLLALLEEKMENLKNEKNSLLAKKMNMQSSDFIKNLESQYSELVSYAANLDLILEKFELTMTDTEIRNLLADIRLLDEMMFDVFSYNSDIVKDVIHKGAGSIAYSKTQIEKLQYSLVRVRQSLSNLKFIEGYNVTDQLPEINDAKCLECPYFKTHPNVVKGKSNNKSISQQLKEKNEEMDNINLKIDLFSDYPIIYGKIKKIEDAFAKLRPALQKLHALKIDNITYILSSTNRIWYDYDRIVEELDLVDKYTKRAELKNKIVDIEIELKKYQISDVATLEQSIASVDISINDTKFAIEEMEKDIDKSNENLKELNKSFDICTSKEKLTKTIHDKSEECEQLCDKIKAMNKDIDTVERLSKEITELECTKYNLQSDLNEYITVQNNLEIRLRDIYECKKNVDALQHKKWLYGLIKDASSPQSGIPLIYVQLFLNDCISNTNDLIANILDDNVELLDIDLNKPDFKIPYRKSNIVMEDVKSASQGERAAISLALSFSLMSKCMEMSSTQEMLYNILLLDEVDAPFYKNAREKFLEILSNQIRKNNIEQVFLISHNECYDGYPINIIATTDTNIDKNVPSINLS